MRFKTKEELIDKYYWTDEGDSAINYVFEFFKERIEFYKRYVYNEPLFEDEEKYISDKWFEYVREQEKQGLWIEKGREIEYNDWLFDYCFGDIK